MDQSYEVVDCEVACYRVINGERQDKRRLPARGERREREREKIALPGSHEMTVNCTCHVLRERERRTKKQLQKALKRQRRGKAKTIKKLLSRRARDM